MAANIDTSQIESFSDDELDAEMESMQLKLNEVSMQLEEQKREVLRLQLRKRRTEERADRAEQEVKALKAALQRVQPAGQPGSLLMGPSRSNQMQQPAEDVGQLQLPELPAVGGLQPPSQPMQPPSLHHPFQARALHHHFEADSEGNKSTSAARAGPEAAAGTSPSKEG